MRPPATSDLRSPRPAPPPRHPPAAPAGNFGPPGQRVDTEPAIQGTSIADIRASPYDSGVHAMGLDWTIDTPMPFVSCPDVMVDGPHPGCRAPQPLPEPRHPPQGATYLLPH